MSDTSSVRWLVLGCFSPVPTGGSFQPTRDGVIASMESIGPTALSEVTISSLKDWCVAKVSTPTLLGLKGLSRDIESGKCSEEEVMPALKEIDGVAPSLLQEISLLLKPEKKSKIATSTSSPDAVDVIFENVASGGPERGTAAKSGVAAFISANKKKVGRKKTSSALKKARYHLEDATAALAAGLLANDKLTALEATWRGLKFLVDQCPSSTRTDVECVDTPTTEVARILRELGELELTDLPDAVYIIEPISMEQAQELAEIGEELQVPIVATIGASLFGVTDETEILDALEQPYSGLGPDWPNFVAKECTRWLTIAVNPFVVFSEGAGKSARVVFGSPVYAVAALLAASYKQVGHFSHILGRAGAIHAPATWTLSSGRHTGVSLPTKVFFSAATQAKLAKLGILGVGSGRNTDQISLNAAPTVRSCQSSIPLPSQILTGQVVRFAQWARDQVPEGASDETVDTLFQEAAHVFLFKGATEGIVFQTEVSTKDGQRSIHIGVDVAPAQSQNRFQLAFSLPLNT